MDLEKWLAERRLRAVSVPMLVAVVTRDGDESARVEAARSLAAVARSFLADALEPPRGVVAPTAERVAELLDLVAIARAVQVHGAPVSPTVAEDLEALGRRVARLFPPATAPAESVRETGAASASALEELDGGIESVLGR